MGTVIACKPCLQVRVVEAVNCIQSKDNFAVSSLCRSTCCSILLSYWVVFRTLDLPMISTWYFSTSHYDEVQISVVESLLWTGYCAGNVRRFFFLFSIEKGNIIKTGSNKQPSNKLAVYPIREGVKKYSIHIRVTTKFSKEISCTIQNSRKM